MEVQQDSHAGSRMVLGEMWKPLVAVKTENGGGDSVVI